MASDVFERVRPNASRCRAMRGAIGKRDSIHHHLLEVTFETANVLGLRQKLLYTTPSGWWWWWCIESVFRTMPL